MRPRNRPARRSNAPARGGRTASAAAPKRRARASRLLRAGALPAWLRFTLGMLAVAMATVAALQFWYLGHVVWWAFFDPGPTPIMQVRLDELRAGDPRARLQHSWVPYARISAHVKRAVVAAEDARFVAHDGVDWEAIGEALEDNLQRGRIVRGGSTITMQLAKNLLLSESRSYLRKAQEVVISYMLEAVLDKRRILELYLNVVEWGVGVFGIEAAAHHHYGVDAARVAPWQAARLAAMLPNPRHYDLNPGSERLQARAASIARWMASAHLP